MFARLALMFITVPLIELYLLFRIHDLMNSAAATIGLILFTGIVGAWLAKQQGLSTILKIQKATAEGRLPATELIDGGMILVAGALLFTPGVLTDAFGFSLLIPACRTLYRKLLKRYFPKPNIQFHSNFGSGGFQSTDAPFDPNVVDGQARTVDTERPAIQEPRSD